MIVDVDSYRYTPHYSAIDENRGVPKPISITFSSALEAATYLSKDSAFESTFQNVIETKFHDCVNYQALAKPRFQLNSVPAFRFYRKKNKIFNSNVLNLHRGLPITDKYQQNIVGLELEIQSSATTVLAGQKLFYGLGESQFNQVKAQGYLPHFLSTSLSIIVAVQHSRRKSVTGRYHDITGRPTLLILTTKSDFKAIFASRGQPNEKELLFQRNAQIKVNSTTYPDGGSFQIVEADFTGFK